MLFEALTPSLSGKPERKNERTKGGGGLVDVNASKALRATSGRSVRLARLSAREPLLSPSLSFAAAPRLPRVPRGLLSTVQVLGGGAAVRPRRPPHRVKEAAIVVSTRRERRSIGAVPPAPAREERPKGGKKQNTNGAVVHTRDRADGANAKEEKKKQAPRLSGASAPSEPPSPKQWRRARRPSTTGDDGARGAVATNWRRRGYCRLSAPTPPLSSSPSASRPARV